MTTLGDFTEDPNRPGTVGRFQATYEARGEKSARAQLTKDEATLGPLHQKFDYGVTGYLGVVSVHWTSPAHRFGKGRLVAIFDLDDRR